MKLSRGVLAALAALMIAAPTAFAADDPAGDPTGVECVAADGGACTDPGGSVEDPPSTGGDDQGDTPGDPGSSDGSGGDDGSDVGICLVGVESPCNGDGGDRGNPDDKGDSTGDDTTTDNGDPTDGRDNPGDGSDGTDPGDGGGDKPDVDLCSWEPWNCDGWTPPNCRKTEDGTKICVPIVDPPVVDPNCKTDPDTRMAYCWQPPEICLVSRFASEADAAAAGCLPPPCVVADDGTVDCGGGGEPYCPDCENPYPPPLCQVAEGANGETWCVRPPPCFIDDEGTKTCAVYDFSPGESRGGDPTSGEDDTVGVCVIGVDSPCNGKPEPRKEKATKGKAGGKGKARGKSRSGVKNKPTTPKAGKAPRKSSKNGGAPKNGGKASKPAKGPKKNSKGANNPKGSTPKKAGAKKPKAGAAR